MNKETRNILMFGRTGSGKSTLANVLTNTDKFKESEFGVSETKDYQVESFEHGPVTYRVIDTIGIGDTKLTPEEVLFKIAMVAKELKKDGINRILFVSRGRFTKEEAATFDMLNKVLFDEKVFAHTTVVRNDFPKFRNTGECDEDFNLLNKVNQDSFPIISKMSRENIIHVNNPPLAGGEYEVVALKEREDSRKILLEHLEKRSTIYRPESINDLGKRVEDHISESKAKEAANNKAIQDLKDQLKNIKDERVSEREKLEGQIKGLQDGSKKLAEDLNRRITQEMANHVGKKVTVTDMMKSSIDMVKEGVTTGADVGSKVMPIIGTAGGALIGAGLGTFGSLTAAAIYFVNTLLGKN